MSDSLTMLWGRNGSRWACAACMHLHTMCLVTWEPNAEPCNHVHGCGNVTERRGTFQMHFFAALF